MTFAFSARRFLAGVAVIGSLLSGVPNAFGQFQDLWQIGFEDGSTAEFGQETGSANPPPGSPSAKDDDYYLQGSYPAPIGVRPADEDLPNFERAVTHTDQDVRIHFNLDAKQAHPDTDFQLTLYLFGGGYWDAVAGAAGLNFGGFGTHDVSILVNGAEIGNLADIQTGTLVDETVPAGAVGVKPGENVITFRRTGGDSEQNGGSSGWIQFDYVRLAADTSAVTCDGICTFEAESTALRPGQGTTLYWLVEDGSTVSINQGIGDVGGNTVGGAGSIRVTPTQTTTYTLTATPPGGPAVEAMVTVQVDAVQEFRQLWLIGTPDGSQAEFHQENGTSNPPPGSATAQDDDYYVAGTYPAPIGERTVDENLMNIDRAITSGDPTNRFHFNLDAIDSNPDTQLRLTLDLIAGGYWDAALGAAGTNFGGFGTHDVTVAFNGNEIFAQTDIQANLPIDETFRAGDVGAVEGPNVITVTRTGGDSEQIGGNSGWIQFDFLRLEADSSAVACLEPICSFTAEAISIQPGASTNLFWLVAPDATVSIDQGIGSVDAITTNGSGSIEVSPANDTTYTLTSMRPGGDPVTQSVTVQVILINDFTASPTQVREGDSAQLTWSVDPDAMVSIEPGIGDVTDLTIGGAGFIDVTPTETTTYVLTATRGPDTRTAEVTIEYNPFAVLWQVGNVDGSQAEFAQENGSSNDPPGSEFGIDDDYYLAGTYPDPIGTLVEDEPWANFERAITSGDPNDRIHFNLTAEQAEPSAQLRLILELYGGGWWDSVAQASGGTFGIHDVEITVNGSRIWDQMGIESALFVDEIFSAGSVSAVAGENVIQITRTGGDSEGNGGSSGWIQMDYVRLEGQFRPAEELRITDVQYDPLLSELTIKWASRIGVTYSVQSSEDLKVWLELVDGYPDGGATGPETSYVLPVEPGTSNVVLRVAEEK